MSWCTSRLCAYDGASPTTHPAAASSAIPPARAFRLRAFIDSPIGTPLVRQKHQAADVTRNFGGPGRNAAHLAGGASTRRNTVSCDVTSAAEAHRALLLSPATTAELRHAPTRIDVLAQISGTHLFGAAIASIRAWREMPVATAGGRAQPGRSGRRDCRGAARRGRSRPAWAWPRPAPV